MKGWNKTLPFLISIGLLTWLMSRISLGNLLRAAAVLQWELIVPLTVVLVIVLYLWDSVCLLTVFYIEGKPLTYSQMLHIRGGSYLVGAFNQLLGQTAVAWNVARFQKISFIAAASRIILLGWHEGLVLAIAALAGSTFINNPNQAHIRIVSIILLVFLLGVAASLIMLPASWRRRLRYSRWGAWLDSWTWSRSLRLILLRIVYFAIVGAYILLALRICRINTNPATALTAIPLVLMASILPSASGLGTRETALYYLLGSQQSDVLIAMGLVWSSGVIIVRLSIGLAWLWFGQKVEKPKEPRRCSSMRDGTMQSNTNEGHRQTHTSEVSKC